MEVCETSLGGHMAEWYHLCSVSRRRMGHSSNQVSLGTWCSGITPAQHAVGPGLNPQRVHMWVCGSKLQILRSRELSPCQKMNHRLPLMLRHAVGVCEVSEEFHNVLWASPIGCSLCDELHGVAVSARQTSMCGHVAEWRHLCSASRRRMGQSSNQVSLGTWCSGITPAQHAGGPGFNPQRVHILCFVVAHHHCLRTQE